MKLAKSILCGVAVLGMTAGAAFANSESDVIADPTSDGLVAWNDSPSEMTTYEQSDTLAFAPSDADADTSVD